MTWETPDGSFSPAARDAIIGAALWRCVGCGSPGPLTTQHRIARGMGGTSSAKVSHPTNGVCLCGSGTTGCHGWVEHHPNLGHALGWVLHRAQDPLERPWWTNTGWRLWWPDLTVSWLEDTHPHLPDGWREAVDAYRLYLEGAPL
jgi:hypothetical protein